MLDAGPKPTYEEKMKVPPGVCPSVQTYPC